MRYPRIHILLVVAVLLSLSPLLAQDRGEKGGEFTPHCIVVSSDDDPPIRVDPDSLVFTCVLPGERVTQRYSITNTSDKPIEVKGFRVGSGGPSTFSVAYRQEFDLAPGATYVDSVTFAPPGPGSWTTELDIDASSGGRRPRILLRGSTSPRPQAAPDKRSLAFGAVRVGDTVEHCVVITNPSCRDLVITGISVAPPWFHLKDGPTFPDTLRAGTRDTLCVAFVPEGTQYVAGQLKIEELNGGGDSVALHGRGMAPGLAASPHDLEFNGVPVGDTSGVMRVAVFNLGAGYGVLDSWEVVGPDSLQFVVEPPPIPSSLAPYHGDTVWFRVRFAPGSVGVKSGELRINNFSDGVVVLLRGTGTPPPVRVLPPAIDMGGVTASTSRSADTLVVENAGSYPVQVVSITLAGGDSSRFTVTGTIPATIGSWQSETYTVTFSPDTVREYATHAIVLLSNGYTMDVPLTGRGLSPIQRRIWLDTADADVNETFVLRLLTDPPLTVADGVTDYVVTLRIDPRALFLHQPVDPGGTPGGAPTAVYVSADTLRIERSGGPPIEGSLLMRIELEGLVTGKPKNIVEVTSVSLGGQEIAGVGSGIVYLTGCDIGRDLEYGRPTKVTSIAPTPASEHAVIRYVAPVGALPSVRVVSLAGVTVMSGSLPSGTGVEQQARVDLGALDPGFYLLELRVGTQRSSLPVVIQK